RRSWRDWGKARGTGARSNPAPLTVNGPPPHFATYPEGMPSPGRGVPSSGLFQGWPEGRGAAPVRVPGVAGSPPSAPPVPRFGARLHRQDLGEVCECEERAAEHICAPAAGLFVPILEQGDREIAQPRRTVVDLRDRNRRAHHQVPVECERGDRVHASELPVWI